MISRDNNLFSNAYDCLLVADSKAKVAAAISLQKAYLDGQLSLDVLPEIKPLPVPGRPEKPQLLIQKRYLDVIFPL